jgi:diguanylate cyclase (GGDEF)-like protein/PAS domain S-box-containing protein
MGPRQTKNVLLIENNLDEAQTIGTMFSRQGLSSFQLTHVQSIEQAEAYLGVRSVSVALLDIDVFPRESCLEETARVQALAANASLVLLTDPGGEQIALRAIEAGAQDYLIKGQIEPDGLLRAMHRSLARKVHEEKLFDEKNRAQITLECIGDAVICTDLSGNITFLNPVAERMTGWSLREASGRPLAESFQIMDAATGERAADPTKKAIGLGKLTRLPVNCILTRRDGHQIFIEDSGAPLLDRVGMAAGSVLVFRDVTLARALAEKLIHLAEHDSLTGLPNRLLLIDRLGQAIAQAARRTSMVAVLFMDLDGFKYVNDSLGHQTGDYLLKSVTKRLQRCIRAPDTVSRQGGDEFVLLLLDLHHPTDAAITAKRILEAVAEPHDLKTHELHVTASIGISIYPNDGLDPETLIKNADTAMYQAKEHGRQNFSFFKKEMNVRAVARQSIAEDLRHALERHELFLVYQPIVNVKSGAVIGAEALLRWNHPTRGSVAPEIFIPVAEDSGLILPIGEWVLRQACMQAKAWADMCQPAITMSVNVSARQFRNEGFLEKLSEILDETGLSPAYLDIEMTETVLMERACFGAPALKSLRDRGLRVAIDDFGTGFSSLSYLQLLPLDVIKIDRSFVSQIATTPNGAAIVTAIIAMGRSLNLRVIAEGIETAQDLAFVKKSACDAAQGFFFGRPVSAGDFAKLSTLVGMRRTALQINQQQHDEAQGYLFSQAVRSFGNEKLPRIH